MKPMMALMAAKAPKILAPMVYLAELHPAEPDSENANSLA